MMFVNYIGDVAADRHVNTQTVGQDAVVELRLARAVGSQKDRLCISLDVHSVRDNEPEQTCIGVERACSTCRIHNCGDILYYTCTYFIRLIHTYRTAECPTWKESVCEAAQKLSPAQHSQTHSVIHFKHVSASVSASTADVDVLSRATWAHRTVLCSRQPDIGQRCKTTHMGLVHHMLCPCTSQISLVLKGWSLWSGSVNLGGSSSSSSSSSSSF